MLNQICFIIAILSLISFLIVGIIAFLNNGMDKKQITFMKGSFCFYVISYLTFLFTKKG